MAIEFTLNDPVNNDQTSGEQSSGMPDGFDTNDTDVTVASLDGGLTLSFYDRLVALGLIVEPLPNDPLSFAEDTYAASQLDSVEVTPSGDGNITSVGFTGKFDGGTETAPALDVYPGGSFDPLFTGDPTGLTTVDGDAIYLFRDEDSTVPDDGKLGDQMVLGVTEDGIVIFTVFMVYDSSDGTIDLHQVTYGAIFHGEPSNDDEEVDLNDFLTVSASEERTFDFNDLPSGQNLFGIVGDLNEQLIIMPEDPDIDGDGEFTNQSETTNTSKGGGPVTIGNSNQMIDPGEGFFFYYVTGANPDYIAGQPGGLDQNEADDADNVDLLVGADTIDVDSAFFDVVQTQGNSAAAVTVTAYLLPDTGGTPQEQREFTNNVDSESGLGSAGVDIIKVQVFGAGDTVNPIEEAVFVGGSSVTTIGGGDTAITITINSDGTAEVTGLDAGMRVKWFTDGLHNLSLVHGEAGKFDIGQFGINQPSGKAASIGDNVIWDDDAPDIERNLTSVPTLTTDDTNIPDTAGPTDFSVLFNEDFGEDGFLDVDDNDIEDDDAVTYALGVSGPAADSGLVDTLTGDAILLREDPDGNIEGYVAAGDLLVFEISVDENSGDVSITQSRAVVHNDPNDSEEVGASAAQMSSAGLVTLTATITDGDGDTNTASADIAQAFAFLDDGPSITRNLTSVPTLTTDDTNIPDTAGPTDFSVLFNEDFGEDGFLDVDDNDIEDDDAVTYALGVSGPAADSGLVDTLTGDAILLREDPDGNIEGYVAAGDLLVFEISVDENSGDVSITQSRAVVHNDPNDSEEVGASAAQMSSAGLVTLTATITDGDGDTNTASADIAQAFAFLDDGPSITRNLTSVPTLTTDDTNIPDTAGPTDFSVLFNEDFGEDGFLDVDDNDIEDDDAVTYALGVSGPAADSGLVDTLTGDAILLREDPDGNIEGYVAAGDLLVFEISVDENSGDVSITQSRAVVHNDPNDSEEVGASAAQMSSAGLVTLTATITDGDGDTNTASADIAQAFAFLDDGPSITRNLTSVPTLTTDDTNIPDTAGPTDFSVLFNEDFGEDGFLDVDDNDIEDDDAVTYALGVSGPAADSGLVDTLTGDAILLREDPDGNIEGYVAAGDLLVFEISVDENSGDVSITQSRAVVHNDPNDSEEAGASAAQMSLAGLVTLTATITDGDGDTNTASADIAQAFAFLDDGPSITRNLTSVPTLTTDDTDIPDTAGPTDFSVLFNEDFGEDGFLDVDDNDIEDDDAVTYALGVSGPAADSGLVDTLTGDAILLREDPDGNIEGYVAAGDLLVFEISVDENSGDVSITQSRAVVHNDPNDSEEVGASAAQMSSAGLVTLTATITDGDGDTNTASADIAQAFAFLDDGPSITRNLTSVPTLTTDDTNIPDTAGPTDFSVLFNEDFGEDGFLDVDDNDIEDDDAVTYALGVSGPAADSGLVDTLTGDAILLREDPDGNIEGYVAAGDLLVFEISVDENSGDVSITQSRAVVHNDPNDSEEVGASAAQMSSAGLVTLTATITDGDGDTNTASADIAQAFAFLDDGPSITRNLTSVPTLTTDDTNIPDTAGPTDFSVLFNEDFGEDGFLDVDDNDIEDDDAVTYALGVSGPAADSGLVDTLTGDAILLREDPDGNIEGYVAAGDLLVFEISVDENSGDVSITQSRAVVHNDPNDSEEVGASAAQMSSAGLVTLTATITDGDGDTNTASADIAQAFAFLDDGPSITRNLTSVPTLTTDDTNIPDTAGPTDFSVLFNEDFGEDGFLDVDDNDIEDDDAVTYALGVSGPAADSGLVDTLTGDAILLREDPDGNIEGYVAAGDLLVFEISVDENSGDVSITQSRAVVHNDPNDSEEVGASAAQMSSAGLVTLTATITDGDGDTNTASADIAQAFAFLDDGPSITRNLTSVPTLTTDDTNIPDTAGPTDFSVLFNEDFGEDGFLDVDDNDIEDDDAVTYALGVSGPAADSGLVDTLTGDAILLREDPDGNIEGYVAAGDLLVFEISVDENSGDVSITQSRAVVHNDPNDSEEVGASAAQMSSAGLVTLTATITDGDGDTNTASADIAQAFAFLDDGPSITRNLTSVPTLTTDDTNIPDTAGPTDFSVLFNEDFGEDGFLDVDDNDIEDDDAVTYALGVSGPAADSGLVDTLTGDAILLREDPDGNIEGYVAAGDLLVFEISVDENSGDVSITQSRAVVHNDPNDSEEVGASAAQMSSAGLVTLTATITDGDGDTNTTSADIAQAFAFLDDGPSQFGSATLPLEEDDIDLIGNDNDDVGGGDDGPGDGSGLRETRKVTLDSDNIISGADQPVSFSIDGDTDPDDVMPTLLSQGLEVHWEAVTGGATEYVRGYTNIDTSRELIIELALTDNGDGTAEAVITVYGQLDHAVEGGGGTENTLLQVAGGGTVSSVDFTPTLEIADGDGDIVPLNSGFLNATDTDDTPEIQGPATDPGIVDFITGNSIDNEDLRGSVGSDGNDSSDENYNGQKTYTFSFPSDVNGDGFFDANDTITSTSIADLEAELSADGTTITYFVDGFGGGAVDGTWEAGERFFDIVLGDQGGSGDYTFNVYQGAPPAFTEFDFEDLPSGQNLHGTIANDLSDPTIGGLLLLPEGTVLDPADGEFTNQSQTTNTSKGGGPVTIGNTNQMFDPGEGHFFAYVSDTDPAMVAGAGLDQNNADDADTVQFGGMDAVTTAQVEIVQVQGNSPATINIKAYDVDYDEFADDGGDPTLIDTNAESRAFVEDPTQHLVDVDGDGTDGQTDPKVISISVYDTVLLDAAADPSTVTPLYTVDIGDGDKMGVTWEDDGSVTVAGLGDDLTVEFTTDVPHDMSLVSNVVGKYDLGGFNLLQIDETPDQLFDYTVDITDFDGDMASDSFQVLVDGTGKFDDGVFDLDPAEV